MIVVVVVILLFLLLVVVLFKTLRLFFTMTTSAKDVSFQDFQDVSDLTPPITNSQSSVPILPPKHDDERDKITEAVYEQLVSSICIDIACGIHKMVKTGKTGGGDLSYADIMVPSNRLQVYPTIQDGRLLSHVEKNVSSIPENGTHIHKRKLGVLLQDNSLPQYSDTRTNYTSVNGELMNTTSGGYSSNSRNSTTDNQKESNLPTGLGSTTANTTEPPPSSTPSSGIQTRNSDIWGRIPPKEPKTLAKCQLCGRSVSTLRFAPHLDKCMGIGTNTRAAAANHNHHPHNKAFMTTNNIHKSSNPALVAGTATAVGSTPIAASSFSSQFLPPPKTSSSMATPNQQQHNMMMRMTMNNNHQNGGTHMKGTTTNRMMTF